MCSQLEFLQEEQIQQFTLATQLANNRRWYNMNEPGSSKVLDIMEEEEDLHVLMAWTWIRIEQLEGEQAAKRSAGLPLQDEVALR